MLLQHLVRYSSAQTGDIQIQSIQTDTDVHGNGQNIYWWTEAQIGNGFYNLTVDTGSADL